MSVTDLKIEEAIREAWAILHAGSAASPSAHRLATALPAMTGEYINPSILGHSR